MTILLLYIAIHYCKYTWKRQTIYFNECSIDMQTSKTLRQWGEIFVKMVIIIFFNWEKIFQSLGMNAIFLELISMFVQQTGSNIQEEALNCYIFLSDPQFRKTEGGTPTFWWLRLHISKGIFTIPLLYSLHLIPFMNWNNLRDERTRSFDLQFQLLSGALL